MRLPGQSRVMTGGNSRVMTEEKHKQSFRGLCKQEPGISAESLRDSTVTSLLLRLCARRLSGNDRGKEE